MLLRYARIYPFYFSTMAAFNGDYQQLATALLVQAGVAGAAGGGAGGGAAAAPEPVAKYAGDYMDIEKVEASAQRWLSENCVDTNATVLQNVRVSPRSAVLQTS